MRQRSYNSLVLYFAVLAHNAVYFSPAAFTVPATPSLRRLESTGVASGHFFPSRLPIAHESTRKRTIATTPAVNDFFDRPLNPQRQHFSTRVSIYSRTTGLAMASPSGIDEWPRLAQAGVFFGTYLAVGLATYPATKLLDSISKSIGLERWREGTIDVALPGILGLLYLAAGIGHFVDAEGFQTIYPPRGTWGIWYLPGSAGFHVAWTGVVAVLGGAGLLFGAIRAGSEENDDDGDDLMINLIKPVCALALFLLTIVVTPADIYMWTHGATLGGTGPLDLSFHYARFVVQVALLSLLLTLARDSFFFAWGDELD